MNSKLTKVSVNPLLAGKPSGCVILMRFDPTTLELGLSVSNSLSGRDWPGEGGRTGRPSCARQPRSDIGCHATLRHPWIQRENLKFETHRLSGCALIRSRIAASRCATLRGLRVRDVDVECEIKITFLGKYAVVSNESELRNDSVHAALARSSPNSPVKADKALVASTLSYATSSSFIGTAIVARSVCSCRNIAAVIGMPRQCFDAVMRLA